MELGAQEKEIKTPEPLGFSSFQESSGGERKRDGFYNHASIFGRTGETPEQYHLQDQKQNHQQQQQYSPDQGDPNPSPVKTTFPLKSTPLKSPVRYMECLKNHAASIGGNVFDGCGEFMQSGDDGTPDAMKCAACNCHRNFHRKVTDGDSRYGSNHRRNTMVHPLQLPPPLPSPILLQQPKLSMNLHASPLTTAAQPMTVAFGGSAGTESSSEDLNVLQSNVAAATPLFGLSKKRFRTKFTQEQKERMLEFAEKVGWRIQNQDEAEIQRFCGEIGVKRQVFKVWMHNNKNSAKKQPQPQSESHPEL